MTWTPITIQEIYNLILTAEKELRGEALKFWEMIKISPEKWEERTNGKEGNGFWVVAIAGNRVIYFNDIEEGFNVSSYKTYGSIEHYHCEQDNLEWTIQKLFDLIKAEEPVQGHTGPPPKSLDSKQLYIAAKHLRVFWKDWIHLGTEAEIKKELISELINDFLLDENLNFVFERANSGLYDRMEVEQRMAKLFGKEDFQLWNGAMTKVIEFNRIGVLRLGTSG